MSVILGIVAFVLLTLLTQIGGVALLIGWLLAKLFVARRSRGPVILAFALVYAAMTVLIVPPLAAIGGRVPLPCGFGPDRHYAAGNVLYCALNRNYVDPRLRSMIDALARHMDEVYPGTRTLYLDANFPFFDDYPLFPHLSHDDGRKLDLAFYYDDAAGQYLPGALRSPIGYWGFEQPAGSDQSACRGKAGFDLRWNMDWLQPLLPGLTLDAGRTRDAVAWLVSAGSEYGVDKLFLEPYLARRLGVGSPLLRFQGCHAARHDDHIHVQIRR